jgi:hypothetical protein
MIGAYWRCTVLIIKLHVDIAHLVFGNMIVYQIMHGMNNLFKLITSVTTLRILQVIDQNNTAV